ncbi:class I SAM-dependent methyltransferase [Photobacterium swingsii]|uniref:class I SAM-dependent methyltransferase n=1 Tax=Photobacterium swingsii TaxID=680026 RepID=UPI003D0EF852
MGDNKWEAFAQDFEQSNNYVVGVKDITLVKSELRRLKDLGSVLELGCGNGTYTECFLETATAITATDISEQMVTITFDRFVQQDHVSVEVADCFKLQYTDASFDTVFMANLLHVIPNPELALAECFRVLKAGGRLIVLSFTLHGMTWLNQLMLKYRYSRKYGTKSTSSIILTPQLAATMVQPLGFKVSSSCLMGANVKAVYLRAEKLAE